MLAVGLSARFENANQALVQPFIAKVCFDHLFHRPMTPSDRLLQLPVGFHCFFRRQRSNCAELAVIGGYLAPPVHLPALRSKCVPFPFLAFRFRLLFLSPESHHHVTPLTRLSISSYFTTLPFSPKHRISPMPDFTCVEQRGQRPGLVCSSPSGLKAGNVASIPSSSSQVGSHGVDCSEPHRFFRFSRHQ